MQNAHYHFLGQIVLTTHLTGMGLLKDVFLPESSRPEISGKTPMGSCTKFSSKQTQRCQSATLGARCLEVFFRESQSPFRLVGLVNPFSDLIETANPSLLSNYHLIFFRLLETKEITK